MIRKEQQLTFDIYIGNVPNHMQQADLKNFFQRYGEVKAVLCRWKNEDIGYAIVKFYFKHDADRVLREVSEVYLKGYHMPIKLARRSDHSYEDQNGVASFKQNVDRKALPPPTRYNNSFPYSNPNSEYSSVLHVPVKEVPQDPLMIEVLCTSVEDAITFYGCPVYRLDELQDFSIAINNLCPKLPRLNRKPVIRQVYAAIYSEDKSWYRCLVQNVTSTGMCTICYIDYGNTEEVRYLNLVELPDALQNVPAFCTKCVFCNLECDKSSSSFSKVSYLEHLVNQRMSLCAYVSPSSLEYQVYKCICNGIDVISESVKKGFAKYKSNQRSSSSKSPVHMTKSLKSKVFKSKNSKTSMDSVSSNANLSLQNSHQIEVLKNGDIKNYKNCISSDINGNEPSAKSDTCSSVNASKLSSHKSSDFISNGTNGEVKSKSDVQPKIIIKRGSDLGELSGSSATKNQSVSQTCKQTTGDLTMIDSVLCNLQLINNIRDLVSTSSNDSIINDAVSLLKSEIDKLLPVEDSTYDVLYEEYFEALNKIRNCVDKALLPDLKLQRDLRKKNFCSKLKEYLDNFDSSFMIRKITIQKTIMDLESKSNAWMNIELEKNPENIEEFLTEYNRVKEQRWNLVCKTRENTNEKHREFLSMYDSLRKEFSLNTLDENAEFSNKLNMSKIGKESYWSTNFSTALKELGKALELEIQTFTNKGSSGLSVIQWILKELDEFKDKVETECAIYENRCTVYNDVNSVSNVESTLSDLVIIQEKIECLETEFIYQKCLAKEQKNTRNTKETALLEELHSAFSRKDSLSEIIVAASETHFPELIHEHPELELLKCQQSRCLLKYDWKPEYFPLGDPVKRLELSHLSHFLDEPVVIKEFKIGDEEMQKNILQRVAAWNEIKSDYLVKIKALLIKDSKTMCALIHSPWKTLLDGFTPLSPTECESACNLLRQILLGLRDIHSRRLVHGAVHPLTILIEDNRILLDICFDANSLKGQAILKGINFQAPQWEEICESNDMYGFGCLVLWMLFPNLLFTTTDENVLNLVAFKSIIEQILSPKDFASLAALLDAKKEKRPSSASLVSNGFLTKSKSYCRVKNNNAVKEQAI